MGHIFTATSAAVVGLALMSSGCYQVLGLGDFKQSGDGGQGGGNTSQGGAGGALPTCGSGGSCVPSTPPGWSGPVAFFTAPDGTAEPACVGAYATTMGPFHSGLDEGVASCACDCDPAQGIQCTTPNTYCETNTCGVMLPCNNTKGPIPPGMCTTIPLTAISPGPTNSVIANPAPTNMGSCMPHPNNVLPKPTWGEIAKACSGAMVTAAGCDAGQVCAPATAAPFDQLCVAAPGDVACPAGPYTKKHVVFESFTDGRTCSACSCGPATSTCDGKMEFMASNCTIIVSTVNAGGCGLKNSGQAPSNARYTPMPSGTCQPDGGMLSGDVTANSALTICCL